MAIIESIRIGSLEIEATPDYAVATVTLYALHASTPRAARLVEMSARHPAYVGSTPQVRQIPLLVMILAKNAEDRLVAYDALVAALSTQPNLATLEWTEGGVTKRLLVHADSIEPDEIFHRAAAKLVAPNPEPEVV